MGFTIHCHIKWQLRVNSQCFFKATFNNLYTTSNLVVDGEITGNGATKLIQHIRSNKIDNRKPVILTIQVGSSKIPIVDLSGNTFASNQWICRIISTSSGVLTNPQNNDTIQKSGLVIGIRNGKWWIANFSGWGIWQHATLEFTPIHGPIEDYYDLKSGFHPSIALDTIIDTTMNNNIYDQRIGVNPNTNKLNTEPANNGYYVYHAETKRFIEVAPPLA